MDKSDAHPGAVANRDEVLRRIAEDFQALASLSTSLSPSERSFRVLFQMHGPGFELTLDPLTFGSESLFLVGRWLSLGPTQPGSASPEYETAFERLLRALGHLDEVPPEVQVELAEIIEEQTEPFGDLFTGDSRPSSEGAPSLPEQPIPRGVPASTIATLPPKVQQALALGGVWRDLQDDDEFAFFDRIRHESPPSPSAKEELAWLDEDHEHDHDSSAAPAPNGPA